MTKSLFAHNCRDINNHLTKLSNWLDYYDEQLVDAPTFLRFDANNLISLYRTALGSLKIPSMISDEQLVAKIDFAYQLKTDTKKFIFANANNFDSGERTLLNEMQFILQDIENTYFQIAFVCSYLQSAKRCYQHETNTSLKQKKAVSIGVMESALENNEVHLTSTPIAKLSRHHSLFKTSKISRKQSRVATPAHKVTKMII